MGHAFVTNTLGGLVALGLVLTPGLTGAREQPGTPAAEPMVEAESGVQRWRRRAGEQRRIALRRWQWEPLIFFACSLASRLTRHRSTNHHVGLVWERTQS